WRSCAARSGIRPDPVAGRLRLGRGRWRGGLGKIRVELEHRDPQLHARADLLDVVLDRLRAKSLDGSGMICTQRNISSMSTSAISNGSLPIIVSPYEARPAKPASCRP